MNLNRHLGAAAAFLEKPISSDRLLDKIKEVLGDDHPIIKQEYPLI